MMSFFKKPWNGHNPPSFNTIYTTDDLLWAVLLFLIFCEIKIVISENINPEQYCGDTFYLTRHHEGCLNPYQLSFPLHRQVMALKFVSPLPRTEEHLWRSRDPLVTCMLCRGLAGKNSAFILKHFSDKGILYTNAICQLCRYVWAVFSSLSHTLGFKVVYRPIKETAIPQQCCDANQKLYVPILHNCRPEHGCKPWELPLLGGAPHQQLTVINQGICFGTG